MDNQLSSVTVSYIWGTIYFAKKGCFCTVGHWPTYLTNIAANYKYEYANVIPSGFRPYYDMRVVSWNVNQNNMVLVEFLTTGTITVLSSLGGNHQIHYSFTYLLA